MLKVTLILSFLNLLFILFFVGDLKNLINFVLTTHYLDSRNYISGLIELSIYYLASFIVVVTSKHFSRLKIQINILNLFLFIIICLILDVLLCFLIFKFFFAT